MLVIHITMDNSLDDCREFYILCKIIGCLKTQCDVADVRNELLKSIPEEDSDKRKLMKSVSLDNGYNILPYEDFCKQIDKLLRTIYINDTIYVANEIVDRTQDNLQQSLVKRISKNRLMIQNSINVRIRKNMEKKQCPHCRKIYHVPNNVDYIICGFTNNKHDWDGCGNDWCSYCEKKLCKSWYRDELTKIENRYHNNKCCRKHSQLNMQNIYPDDYCQCYNKHVNRT